MAKSRWKSKDITLLLSGALLVGMTTGVTGCSLQDDDDQQNQDANNQVQPPDQNQLYQNNSYLPGVGYYHASVGTWYPFPYNYYNASTGYFYAGGWNKAPATVTVVSSRPSTTGFHEAMSHWTSSSYAHANSSGFSTARGGFGDGGAHGSFGGGHSAGS